ncbi:MAG TPA: filamentous hemagglutinin N-terminal domain-containing protein, partial [Oxalicibacterium sp.]|nr:filamentous hemagglutinin N-terminal domain-containing protein [Oxalicibacterium sp.]
MRASKPFPSAALLALLLYQSVLAQTLPSGGTVVKGSATIQPNGANQVIITQTSSKAIINWKDFSIGAGGTVSFDQPDSRSIILNRVVDGGPRSNIYGKLTANGQVFIVNPNGVYFGAGSSVDVGGLLATTLNINDDDFLNGNYVFTRGSLDAARREVINEGVLKARGNGYVVLAGDYAANRGIVQAKLGTVALASGSKMTLDVQGDSLISFAVNEKTVAQLSGVENSGQLLADGGRAIMTAAVATDLQTAVVNNTGLVRANTAEERNGEIILSADGGNTQNSGTLDVSGKAAGQKGGSIKVLGNKVALTGNALLDASGDAGGGTINVGGNYQGKGPL